MHYWYTTLRKILSKIADWGMSFQFNGIFFGGGVDVEDDIQYS